MNLEHQAAEGTQGQTLYISGGERDEALVVAEITPDDREILRRFARRSRWRPRRSPLTGAVNLVLRGEPLDAATVREVIRGVTARNKRARRERLAAVTLLTTLPLEGALRSEAAAAVAHVFARPEPGITIVTGVLLMMMNIFALPLLVAAEKRRARVRGAMARCLGKLGAAGAIGPLVEALNSTQWAERRFTREEAHAALRTIVPLVPPGDYGRLGPEAVEGLCRLLYHEDEALALAALDALHAAGTGAALPSVEPLAQAAGRPAIKAKVEVVLPVLRERHERETASSTLLRAAASTEQDEAVLLRPARDTGESESALLLRPNTEKELR